MAKKQAASANAVTVGEVVHYTLSEHEAKKQAETHGVAQAEFAAMVTAVDQSGAASLTVFLPGGRTLAVSGVSEGDGPNTLQART